MKLIIYGCGGHARSVADIALTLGFTHLIFVDKNAKEQEKIFGAFDIIPYFPDTHPSTCIVAFGDNHERAKQLHLLVQQHHEIITLLSPHAYLGKNAQLDRGVVVGHHAHIGPNAHIGQGTILNTRSIIEHDCNIGQYCHVSVNSTVAGKTHLGDYVTVGAGATIIDRLDICSNVTIGAGAVVVNAITEPGVYVGTPARKIHQSMIG